MPALDISPFSQAAFDAHQTSPLGALEGGCIKIAIHFNQAAITTCVTLWHARVDLDQCSWALLGRR
jgi:hypothetical protein